MPMVISTKFFGLVEAFLVLYVSVASATPIPVTPNTPALLRRVPPGGHLCGGAQWTSAWKDICRVFLGPGPNGPTVNSDVYSSCPPQNTCSNIVDGDGDRSIKCVNVLKPGTVQTRTKSMDPEIGASVVKDAPITVSPLGVDVNVANDMKASVSAVVLSADQDFALATSKVIVGKVSQSGVVVCQGNQSDTAKARECYPLGRFGLKEGETINFTWGMTEGQQSILEYTVWPTL